MATNAELIDYYKNTLILQYRQMRVVDPEAVDPALEESKATRHITALVKAIMIFELIEDVQNGFNLDDSIGVQLDILGKYINFDRKIKTTGGSTRTLADSEYRVYLKAKVALNTMDSTLYDIDTYLETHIPASSVIDTTFMALTYQLEGLTLVQTQEMVYNDMLPHPTGVDASDMVYEVPANEGFRCASAGVPVTGVKGFGSAGALAGGKLAVAIGAQY